MVVENCWFQCLSDCPLPSEEPCIWDDPDIPLPKDQDIFYDEFYLWREENKKLMRREPKDPLRARCNRCLSVRVAHADLLITCLNCGYTEPLIDFPCSETFWQFFEGVGAGVREATVK